MLGGYLGGWVDSVIMRFYDALLAFPGIIIGIAVISVLGPSSVNVAYALALGGMPFFARLMRSSVLSERERDYVLRGALHRRRATDASCFGTCCRTRSRRCWCS